MSRILKINSFTDNQSWLATVKNLEKRWGLTIVSFLPNTAQKEIKLLQNKIRSLPSLSIIPADSELEFYGIDHLHCTHFTLTRSNGWGQIKANNFVKPKHNLFELFNKIHDVTKKMQPLDVKLDSLKMSNDGIGITLTGSCNDKKSIESRKDLLEHLNKELHKDFIIYKRSWDGDSSKFHNFHCRIGILKRPIKEAHRFVESLENIIKDFSPISFILKNISIVHHRYRSLTPPQEGEFLFPLGVDISKNVKETNFIQKIKVE